MTPRSTALLQMDIVSRTETPYLVRIFRNIKEFQMTPRSTTLLQMDIVSHTVGNHIKQKPLNISIVDSFVKNDYLESML